MYFLTTGQVALLEFSQWSVLEPSGIRAECLISESSWTCAKETRHPLQATVTWQELRVKVPNGGKKKQLNPIYSQYLFYDLLNSENDLLTFYSKITEMVQISLLIPKHLGFFFSNDWDVDKNVLLF